MTAPSLPEHFFRHEYGKLVATLVRRAGAQHFELIEDATQSALLMAVDSWPRTGLPENPSAWLFRVAHNDLIGQLRKRARERRLLEQSPRRDVQSDDPSELGDEEMQDDLLRMLFACCDDTIAVESQLVLALKTLCGFNIREIALRLFITEANAYKRFDRARRRLRERPPPGGKLQDERCASRLPAVHKVLYVLFTEGHLSVRLGESLRTELCADAIRLAEILAEHPAGQVPETFALLALMHFHAARMTARQDASGGLLLLEEQDRELWDRARMHTGLEWLAKSAQGSAFSRYHAEAGIAAEHCLAPSFDETRWDRVVECYRLLEKTAPSPIHRLNCAVAVAEWKGPAAGLATLEGFVPPTWLASSYLWAAVMADLHRRCGDAERARDYREAALDAAPTQAVRQLLERRLAYVAADGERG